MSGLSVEHGAVERAVLADLGLEACRRRYQARPIWRWVLLTLPPAADWPPTVRWISDSRTMS